MKTVTIPREAADINVLLEQARREDVLVRAADGAEFLLTVVEDFDQEIARSRQNAKLMALLDTRAKQTQTVPLDEVKQQLGLGE